MPGEKDRGKSTSPMFPKLHLHDNEKGGPKAPPRNKMALFEQLSVSSQKFNSGSSASLPLPPNSGGSLVPSMSQTHDGCHEGTKFSPFNKSPAQSCYLGKLPTYSPAEFTSYASVSTFQSSNVSKTLALAEKCPSFQLNNISNYNNIALEKVSDASDYRVPLFSQSRISYFNYSQQNNGSDKNSYPRTSCSLQLRLACEKQLEGTNITELNSAQHVRHQSQKDRDISQTHYPHPQRSVSFSLTKDNILEDGFSIPPPKEQSSMSSKRKYISINQEGEGCSRDKYNYLHSVNAHTDKESLVYKMVSGDKLDKETRNDINVRSGLFSRSPREDNNKTSNGLDDLTNFCAPKECDLMQIEELDRRNTSSKHCLTDSTVSSGLCSDDVVKVLGEKIFWKARSMMVNQQRIFATQIFELHRLIAVQRKISKSPQLLVEGSISVRKGGPKNLSRKENFPNHNANENRFEKFPPLSTGQAREQTNTRHINKGMGSGTVLESPVSPLAKLSSWSFPPPGSQWLVPVISPIEGLVYKPYTGPYPPPAGFLAPAYGSQGSMNLTGKSEDYPTTAFGIAASNQEFGILPGITPFCQSYVPPYGLPVMNSSISISKPEQMHLLPKAQSKAFDSQFPSAEINLNVPHNSAFKIYNHMSRTNSVNNVKFQGSKESELQGTLESNPQDKEKASAITLFPVAPTREMAEGLPLFPTVPTLQACNKNAQTHESELQTEVIKVVPHNPKLLSEPALRIYQSIQEERKQL